jgi:WhiB family redox-sensing transcriptional regulator
MSILDLRLEAWTQQAACINYDPALWYPENEGPGGPGARARRTAAAKEICAGCPVRLTCLDAALAEPRGRGAYGVWGGLDEHERAQLIAAVDGAA